MPDCKFLRPSIFQQSLVQKKAQKLRAFEIYNWVYLYILLKYQEFGKNTANLENTAKIEYKKIFLAKTSIGVKISKKTKFF